MELLQAGVERSSIAIWLAHESLRHDADLLGCKPRNEGGNPGENATAEE